MTAFLFSLQIKTNTFHKWANVPYTDASLLHKLTKRHFEKENRNSAGEDEDDKRDEKSS